MINHLLVTLINSVLGRGKQTSRGNYAYHCPFCKHSKPKLEVNFTENKKGHNPWHCWVCNTRGKTIPNLLKKVEAYDKIDEAKKLIPQGSFVEEVIHKQSLSLPKEYTPFIDKPSSLMARHAIAYLKSRGVTIEDMIKYHMGYCEEGEYQNMIIIPSYDDNGSLNYFTARSFEKDPYRKYKNPSVSRNIVPFEMFINWSSPLVLCEGPFDAIAIKRNAIPLLGKNIQTNLMKKIVSSKVEKIYIALDSDAIKSSLKFCETFMNEGKEVHLLEMDDKDPSELGFKRFTKLIQKSTPLTLSGLLARKLAL
jgi:transcription elongation factor Elf1